MIENIVKLNTVRTIMQNKLKYRKDLKRPLTSGEVDANFEFLAQAVSGAQFGIKDMVLPNAPAPSESGQYPVKQAGVYSGFKDSNGQAISVTADDFKTGIVYIIYNGTYSYKFIAPIPLDGEVAEGDMRGVSGSEVFYKFRKVLGDEIKKILPKERYLDDFFSTNNSTDTYYWDTRCLVNKGDVVDNVSVLMHSEGVIAIALLDVKGQVHKEVEFQVQKGLNKLNISEIVIDKQYYIAVRTKSAWIKLEADTGVFYNKKNFGSDIVEAVKFKLAYIVTTVKVTGGVEQSINELNIDVGNINDEIYNKVDNFSLPKENNATLNITTHSGSTDNIYFDNRVFLENNKEITVFVNCKTAGNCNIVFTNTAFKTIKTIPFIAKTGVNEVLISDLDSYKNYYVGIQPIGSSFNIGANSNIKSAFKIDNKGVVSELKYDLAYEVIIDENTSLNSRIEKLEVEIFIPKIFYLKKEINKRSDIIIPEGEHFIEDTVFIPSGKTLKGVKGKSILKVLESAKQGLNIDKSNDIRFQDFVLRGIAADTLTDNNLNPVASGVVDSFQEAYDMHNIGDQTGIRINGGERIIVDGLEITNFSEHALHTSLSGKRYLYAIQVINNFINNNYSGIKTDKEAERSFYSGNYCTLNQIGFYMDSGTNMIDNNSFNANRVGMVLADGHNHAHGVISNSPFTHASLFGLVAYNIEHGQLFNSCKFGYGDVYLYKSKGLQFESSQLIGSLKITNDGVNDKDVKGVNSFANSFSNTGNVTAQYINGANMMRLKNNWTANLDHVFNTRFNN